MVLRLPLVLFSNACILRSFFCPLPALLHLNLLLTALIHLNLPLTALIHSNLALLVFFSVPSLAS